MDIPENWRLRKIKNGVLRCFKCGRFCSSATSHIVLSPMDGWIDDILCRICLKKGKK